MAAEPLIYRDATDEEQDFLEQVQAKYHAALPFVIGLYFRNKPKQTGGTVALATAHKSSTFIEHLAHCDGYIEVWEEAWFRDGQEWREYLLDHELSHFSVSDKGELVVRHHDIEDFEAVLLRHPQELRQVRRLLEDAELPQVSEDGRPTTDD